VAQSDGNSHSPLKDEQNSVNPLRGDMPALVGFSRPCHGFEVDGMPRKCVCNVTPLVHNRIYIALLIQCRQIAQIRRAFIQDAPYYFSYVLCNRYIRSRGQNKFLEIWQISVIQLLVGGRKFRYSSS
jgi:hypothetical protein